MRNVGHIVPDFGISVAGWSAPNLFRTRCVNIIILTSPQSKTASYDARDLLIDVWSRISSPRLTYGTEYMVEEHTDDDACVPNALPNEAPTTVVTDRHSHRWKAFQILLYYVLRPK